jgi:hypothetical protein
MTAYQGRNAAIAEATGEVIASSRRPLHRAVILHIMVIEDGYNSKRRRP